MTCLEVIEAFTVAPSHSGTRAAVHITDDREACAQQCLDAEGSELQLFTVALQRNGLTGYSVVVWMEGQAKSWRQRTMRRPGEGTHSRAAAIMEAADGAVFALTKSEIWRRATIHSDSKAALQVIANPRHRSGQRLVQQVHDVVGTAAGKGTTFRSAGCRATTTSQVMRKLTSWRWRRPPQGQQCPPCHGLTPGSNRSFPVSLRTLDGEVDSTGHGRRANTFVRLMRPYQANTSEGCTTPSPTKKPRYLHNFAQDTRDYEVFSRNWVSKKSQHVSVAKGWKPF